MRKIPQNFSLDKNFIDRIIWTSVWVTAVVGLFFLGYRNYVPVGFRWGFLFGALCGIGNLYFLKMVITSFITPTGVRWIPGIVGAVGLHAVVGTFLYIAWLRIWSAGGLLIGFSLFLIIAFLKAVGIMIMQKE